VGGISAHEENLRSTITEFVSETQSQWGQYLLDNFSGCVKHFVLVKPKAADIDQLLESPSAGKTVQEKVA
jgi:glutamate synthase (NADPH/NADH) large chain